MSSTPTTGWSFLAEAGFAMLMLTVRMHELRQLKRARSTSAASTLAKFLRRRTPSASV
jgi:hypothetical protein